MGKGNCLLAFAEMGVGMIRAAMGCLCCMIICGPIFFLAGIIMLVGPNNYKQHVNDWNNDNANFTKETVPLLKETALTMQLGKSSDTFGVSKFNLQATSVPVTPDGNTKDVNSVNSWRFTTGDNYYQTRSDMQVTINSTFGYDFQGKKNPSQLNIISSSTTTSANNHQNEYTNTKHTVTVKCEDDDCSSEHMRKKCAEHAPKEAGDKHMDNCVSSNMIYTDGSKQENQHGTCTFYTGLTYFCQPLYLVTDKEYLFFDAAASGSSSNSAFYTSCDYPFTHQKRQCVSPGSGNTAPAEAAIQLKFMSYNDPHITLSKITKGSMNFGLTSAQQRVAGVGFIIVGLLLMAGLIGMCIAMRDVFCGRNHHHRAAAYGAFGRRYEHPDYNPMMSPYNGAQQQQPLNYGQNQPAQPYGQQQQQYGQQPVQQQQGVYGEQQQYGAYQQQQQAPPPPGYGGQPQQQQQQQEWGQPPQKPQQQQQGYGGI